MNSMLLNSFQKPKLPWEGAVFLLFWRVYSWIRGVLWWIWGVKIFSHRFHGFSQIDGMCLSQIFTDFHRLIEFFSHRFSRIFTDGSNVFLTDFTDLHRLVEFVSHRFSWISTELRDLSLTNFTDLHKWYIVFICGNLCHLWDIFFHGFTRKGVIFWKLMLIKYL